MWHIHYTYLSCQTFQYIPNTNKKNTNIHLVIHHIQKAKIWVAFMIGKM